MSAQRGLESRLGRQACVLQADHHPVGAGAGDTRQSGRARRRRYRRRPAGERRAVARGQGQAQGDLDAAIQCRHLHFDEQHRSRRSTTSMCAAPSPLRCPMTTCSRRPCSAAARRCSARPGPTASRPSGAYPIPQPVKLDLEKAKEYLKAAGHAGRLLDHVQLQCRSGFDRRTDGGAGRRNRSPRSASRSISRRCRTRRCRRRSTRRSFPSSPRASSPGCPRPTISTAISTPAISAGTTHRSTIPNWWRLRRKPVSSPTRPKYEEDGQEAQRHPFQRNAADSALATEPGRGDGALDRRLHLSVSPPGRLSRPQPQVTRSGMMAAFGATMIRAGEALPVLASGALWRARLHLSC